MKIRILTLRLHNNYGGILQAYALQTVLERMGHRVEVLDIKTPRSVCLWKRPLIKGKWLLIYGKRLIQKYLFGKKIRIFLEQYERKHWRIMCQNTYKFIDKYIHQHSFDSVADLGQEHFEAYVVGSDQVWRPIYFGEIEHAFLDFTTGENILRISYAASFGVDNWEYSPRQTVNCQKLLQNFNAVSVREKSGVDLCKKYLLHDAEWVLDPTMLLKMEDYVNLIKAAETPKSKGNLMFYILDENPSIMDFIHRFSTQRGLTPFRVGARVSDRTAPIEERIQPPLEEWLRGFYDAEFVVTDSFHACVFSILFKKQFIVLGNKERGMARFESLLDMFGLKECLVDVKSTNVETKKINYDEVYAKLGILREHSMNFLNESLNKKA